MTEDEFTVDPGRPFLIGRDFSIGEKFPADFEDWERDARSHLAATESDKSLPKNIV